MTTMTQQKPIQLHVPEGVNPSVTRFQAAVLRSALKLYIKTGMKANRAYTVTNMIAMVNKLTGQSIPTTRKYLEQALTTIEDAILHEKANG